MLKYSGSALQKQPVAKSESTRFETSCLLDFFGGKELIAQTGHEPYLWPLVILKEAVDDALDARDEAGMSPSIHVTVDDDRITRTDAGPGICARTESLQRIGSRDYLHAHLYWLLEEPIAIDDGDPRPIFTEFIDQGDGKKKKRRKSIKDENGAKVYIDGKDKRNAPLLSPKAQHVQDILAGIAAKIGGDHTTDLSRLLRMPGTFNRKDQRNGREPERCRLLEFHPERRYALELFAPLAKDSPDRRRREMTAKVKLPAPRRVSREGKAKFHDLLLACEAAEVGTRSEVDYRLCCWAIKQGLTKDEVWTRAQRIGKFAEGGERYFDRTWSKAEEHVRECIYKRAEPTAARSNGNPNSNGHATKGSATIGAGVSDKDLGIVKLLADAINQSNHFARDAGGRLYRYVNGVFKPGAENYIKAQVKRLCVNWEKTKQWSSRLAAESVEFIRVDSPELPGHPSTDLVNTENGMVRTHDGVLLPHDPKYLSTIQLPVQYDPAATCHNIEDFVRSSFPVDAHDLAWEIPGVLMVPVTWLQKAILLLGDGGNGKSTFLSLIIRFLGKHNISTISLHRLESDRFSVSRLVGKLANICADLPSEHLAGTSTFKALTGGDTLSAEFKFKDSFDLDPFARLVFSANHPPRSADSSSAFFRRWTVIPFDRSFDDTADEIPRDVLDARLQAPGELSGLLNRALEGLRRVQRQRQFTEPESVNAALKDFRATTDPLAVWLDRNTIDDPASVVVKQDLRDAYNVGVERDGRPTMTAKAFGQAIYKLRPNMDEKQRMIDRKLQWCYVGIGLSKKMMDSHDSLDSRD